MLRRFLLPAVLFATAFSMTACSPKYPKCDNDSHCKEHGEVCVNGTCQECGRDPDCKAGFVCRETKCVPKPECSASSDCQAGFKCRDQKCVPECTADADCAGGMQCRAGRCAPAPECNSDADCPAGKHCDDNQRCAEGSRSGACTLDTVRFGFNEYSLTREAQNQLDRNADCLKSRRGAVTVAGHADERGTEEYNLHLGERRANSVAKYLTNLGVEKSAVKTVSYGKERPEDLGHDEAAWARNRRVEFNER